MRFRLVVVFMMLICARGFAQLSPEDLNRDNYVKLMMKDSSEFYVIVITRPLPDRLIVETRHGRLEIPLKDINYAVDYRYNFAQKEALKADIVKNNLTIREHDLQRFTRLPKRIFESRVQTKAHDVFKGYRYDFEDTAHLVLSTDYGNLFFTYASLAKVDNWSRPGEVMESFKSGTYLAEEDPRLSQSFLTPNAHTLLSGHGFIADFMLAGLHFNYSPTDWLLLNAGGVFAPFLPTSVVTGTAGLKISPYQSEKISIAVGGQLVHSEVVSITRIGFPYVVVTYGTWEGELSVLGGIAYKSQKPFAGGDPNLNFSDQTRVLGVAGDVRVGENLKAMGEFFFIQNFQIVPTILSMRYFQHDLTVDIGVVLSLYQSGARDLPTLGEYVFHVDFPIIPMVSLSYHF